MLLFIITSEARMLSFWIPDKVWKKMPNIHIKEELWTFSKKR